MARPNNFPITGDQNDRIVELLDPKPHPSHLRPVAPTVRVERPFLEPS